MAPIPVTSDPHSSARTPGPTPGPAQAPCVCPPPGPPHTARCSSLCLHFQVEQPLLILECLPPDLPPQKAVVSLRPALASSPSFILQPPFWSPAWLHGASRHPGPPSVLPSQLSAGAASESREVWARSDAPCRGHCLHRWALPALLPGSLSWASTVAALPPSDGPCLPFPCVVSPCWFQSNLGATSSGDCTAAPFIHCVWMWFLSQHLVLDAPHPVPRVSSTRGRGRAPSCSPAGLRLGIWTEA